MNILPRQIVWLRVVKPTESLNLCRREKTRKIQCFDVVNILFAIEITLSSGAANDNWEMQLHISIVCSIIQIEYSKIMLQINIKYFY